MKRNPTNIKYLLSRIPFSHFKLFTAGSFHWDGTENWLGWIDLSVFKSFMSYFYLRSKSRSTCVCLSACLSVSLSQILSSETKLYSPNLCLGISIVGHVVVWFVCQFFMSWSGIPHSFHKILLLWWKTTGLAPHIKCQPVCLFMSFILRKLYDPIRHFLFFS